VRKTEATRDKSSDDARAKYMKDRKSAVLAAIDDSWRQFRKSLDQLVSENMSKPGVLEQQSVTDVIGHITTWE
jgi:hypothetical protein